MLNGYFAFGVPVFLIVLYIFFEWIRLKTHVHYYIGFILLLISSFMTVFSFQVMQEFWASNAKSDVQLGYSPNILWFPLILGMLLIILNCGRGLKRIYAFEQERKQTHKEND
ncbi:hypothetical protein ACYSNR_17710 [Enterococcus sp. LJL128]|uniref:hypothetical protein n=1 Tax=Enterococcus sp. LJL51 TaxID=3416656 RepID=UPI003CE6A786